MIDIDAKKAEKTMELNTRFTVGSVILAIMLLSIFGVNRALQSLTGSDSADRIASERVDAFTDTTDRGDSNARTRNEDGELVLTPLQEAGTFIQRQKRIEEDPAVEGTEVAVLPVSDSTASDSAPTPAQPNTINNDQTGTSSNTSTSPSPRPTNTTPSNAPAVPALW